MYVLECEHRAAERTACITGIGFVGGRTSLRKAVFLRPGSAPVNLFLLPEPRGTLPSMNWCGHWAQRCQVQMIASDDVSIRLDDIDMTGGIICSPDSGLAANSQRACFKLAHRSLSTYSNLSEAEGEPIPRDLWLRADLEVAGMRTRAAFRLDEPSGLDVAGSVTWLSFSGWDERIARATLRYEERVLGLIEWCADPAWRDACRRSEQRLLCSRGFVASGARFIRTTGLWVHVVEPIIGQDRFSVNIAVHPRGMCGAKGQRDFEPAQMSTDDLWLALPLEYLLNPSANCWSLPELWHSERTLAGDGLTAGRALEDVAYADRLSAAIARLDAFTARWADGTPLLLAIPPADIRARPWECLDRLFPSPGQEGVERVFGPYFTPEHAGMQFRLAAGCCTIALRLGSRGLAVEYADVAVGDPSVGDVDGEELKELLLGTA